MGEMRSIGAIVATLLVLLGCGSSGKGAPEKAAGAGGGTAVDGGSSGTTPEGGADDGTAGAGAVGGGAADGGAAGGGAAGGGATGGGAAGSAAGASNGGAAGASDPPDAEDVRQVLGSVCDFLERCQTFQLAVDSREECIEVLEFFATCELEMTGSRTRPVFELRSSTIAFTPALGGCVRAMARVSGLPRHSKLAAHTLHGDGPPLPRVELQLELRLFFGVELWGTEQQPRGARRSRGRLFGSSLLRRADVPLLRGLRHIAVLSALRGARRSRRSLSLRGSHGSSVRRRSRLRSRDQPLRSTRAARAGLQ